MKAILSLVFLVAGLCTVNSQQYKPVDEKSEIKFTVKNFGINTSGSLNGLKGAITFNTADLPSSSFNVSADINTVNTGMESRDSHLKKEEYFDAEKFPTISFVSKNITKDQNGYIVTGGLTIKGITKTISFPFTVQNTVQSQDEGIIFIGSFSINRKDFDIGGSSAVLGNNVDVSLKVVAVK